MNKSVPFELPTFSEMEMQTESIKYYPHDERLAKESELLLSQKFNFRYFCLAQASDLEKAAVNAVSLSEGISTKGIHEISQEEYASFTIKTFFDKFPAFQNNSDKEQFRRIIPKYFKEQIFGKGYFVGGEMVGVIVSHHWLKHPAISGPTLHVGYLGYERNGISKHEARGIKGDWLKSLAKWSSELGQIPIDASVDWFNEASFTAAITHGFKIRCLRLDKRP